MRKMFILTSLLLSLFNAKAQLPLKIFGNNDTNPLIFYLSGDGGFNSFSTNFCDTLSKRGYTVYALNSKSYFWDKKEPKDVANAFAGSLQQALNARKNKKIIFIGYSFGADVLPFIYNNMGKPVKDHISHVFLLSPAKTADFKIHLADMMFNVQRPYNVGNEINRMQSNKLVILQAKEDKDLDFKTITARNTYYEELPGDHNFNKDYKKLASTIVKWL